MRSAADWPSCKKQQLCKRIDSSYVLREPLEPIAHYQSVTQKLTDGHVTANLRVQRASYPSSFSGFRRLICDLHQAIFGEAAPSRAGRFREGDEHIEFGGEGHNKRSGAPPSEIENQLRAVHLPSADELIGMERTIFAGWAAKFLAQFFRVHPFHDGNGRVGRFFVDLAARQTSRWFILGWPTSVHDRRRYVQALEYAHRHVPGSGHPGFRYVSDPYRYLTSRIDKIILEISSLEISEEPPFWDELFEAAVADEPEPEG